MNVLDEIQQNSFRDYENLTKEFISPQDHSKALGIERT
jgi:hypothetical protein